MTPPALSLVLRHLDALPENLGPDDLGTVLECTWDGKPADVSRLEITKNSLDFLCPPPTNRACSQFERWENDSPTLKTSKGFEIRADSAISGIQEMSFGSSGQRVTVRCHLFGWRALLPSSGQCLWGCRLNMPKESRALRTARGNLRLEGYSAIQNEHHWIFAGSYTVVLIRRKENDWFIFVDTGSSDPPNTDLQDDLTLIGFLCGHPLHVSTLHRISTEGDVTGHSNVAMVRIGHTAPLEAGAVPLHATGHRVDFFNAIHSAVKARPELVRLVRVPIGHHFEAHGRSIESTFAHAWIAVESFIAMAERFGFWRRTPSLLAEKDGWIAWVNSNVDSIKSFALLGKEHDFLNMVRQCFADKPSKVEEAFRRLSIGWTPEMDQVGGLRGSYIHEGSPRDYAHEESLSQIQLLRTMLAALYARVFNYEGPIADYENEVEPKGPSWWLAKTKDAVTSLVTVVAPTTPATSASTDSNR